VAALRARPDTVHVAGTDGPAGRGSVAEVVLGYSDGIARCASSSLMPKAYGMRGGYRATFTGAVLEYTMRAGFTGQGPSTLTEYTTDGERAIELPTTSPYAAMIDHVLACLNGHADNQIEPTSALAALELTLDVHQRLTQPTG
jgi:hypothetical protein